MAGSVIAEGHHAPLLGEAPSTPDGLRVIESNGRGRGLAATREAGADIDAGDEVTINYHGEPDDPRPVWFPAR